MFSRVALLWTVCIVATAGGCVTQTRVNTVPWWKGLPAMVVAPSSIEAHVWRQHVHNRGCQHEMLAEEPCPCESMVGETLDEYSQDWDADAAVGNSYSAD